MRVRVVYFAAFADWKGASAEELDLRDGCTVEQAFQAAFADCPQGLSIRSQTLFAINDEYVDAGCVLNPGDELLFLPPISGG